jgi:hypothetical protein
MIARIIVCALLLCAMACTKKQVEPHKPVVQTSVKTELASPRPTFEQILARRENYWSVLGMDQIPYADQFTPEYFTALTKRRADIISWAAQAKPEIIFIGQAHIDLSGENSANYAAVVDRVQQWVFETLKVEAKNASLITFEQFGTDERVTKSVMIRIAKEQFQMFGKAFPLFKQPTDEEIALMVETDTQGITRAIRGFTSPPIYCGEEWPNAVESIIILMVRSMPSAREIVAKRLIEDFNWLRSEIILIRTLEFLRTQGGNKAMIVQGLSHASQLEAIASEYNVTLRVFVPSQ